MISLQGYRIEKLIYESLSSLIYRGYDQTNQSVIFKVLKEEYPTIEELTRFRYEYEMSHKLEDQDGVIQVYALEKYQNSLVMILEDFGGESLFNLFFNENKEKMILKLNLEEFLSLAIQIVEAVCQIHQKQIMHKDLNPSNILWKRGEENKVKLIDLGISSELSREKMGVVNPNLLEGTLAYLSPEQTGRMNRSVDYRTDLYSLGITFYQLLTGELPFQSQDSLEMVHQHIAKIPQPPHHLKPEIPLVVSQILLKLMAKNAEDRYQSASGLKVDLQRCLNCLQKGEELEVFPLGKKDYSEKFRIPQKLYGREEGIETLMQVFKRVQKGITEILLVSGNSGIGKTSLVKEIDRVVVEKKGYFISGKFGQLNREIPHAPIIQAFQELALHLLTEGKLALNSWKEKLLQVLEGNGQVLIDAIPEMEWILGKQSPLEDLSPTAAKNRFHRVLQNFVKVFAKPKHPLVLFLDDLQWMDFDSFQWIEQIITEGGEQALFFIGAYRDKEVKMGSSLSQILEKKCKIPEPLSIHLSPLNLKQVELWLTEAMNHDQCRSCRDLAELVFQKTRGNPFFVSQFVYSLYEEGLLLFDLEQGKWQWDLEKIQKRKITDNVVQFLADKLQKFPSKVQEILKLAACIGNPFSIENLALIAERSREEVEQELSEAVREEVIFSLQVGTRRFQFLHDRIQQAAYSLISEEKQKKIHLKIGQLFLQKYQSSQIFDVVHHLNLGLDLLETPKERRELVELNRVVGKKSKASNAHELALQFFKTALTLLEKESWKKEYKYALLLHIEAVETAFLYGDFQQAEIWSNEVIQNAKDIVDQSKVHLFLIKIYTLQKQKGRAIEEGLRMLKALGVEIPENPSLEVLEREKELTEFALAKFSETQSLLNLPIMTDPKILAAIPLLNALTLPLSTVNYYQRCILSLKIVQFSIQYGNSPYSTGGYLDYGVLLCCFWDDFDRGYQFGELTLGLLEKNPISEIKAEVDYMMTVFVFPWREHLKKIKSLILENFQITLENGEFDLSYNNLRYANIFSFYIGTELGTLLEETLHYDQLIKEITKENASFQYLRDWQFYANLAGKGKDPCVLAGEYFNEEEMIPIFLKNQSIQSLTVFYGYKAVLCYFFEEYQQGGEYLLKAEKGNMANSIIHQNLFFFYGSLLNLATFSPEDLSQVERRQIRLKKWADANPVNYLHKWYLVEAERHRLAEEDLEAIHAYEKSIHFARKNEYIQDEALACELYGKFWLKRENEEIAQLYFNKAYHCYQLWGAFAKVEDLEKRYPQWLAKEEISFSPSLKFLSLLKPLSIKSTDIAARRSVSIVGRNDLDMITVMKASQVIASEIVLERFLKKMIENVIENMGAARGLLIMKKKEDWWIEVEGTVNAQTLLESVPLEQGDQLCKKIVYYVIQTQESIVLDDAFHEGEFRANPYILENQSKSILCFPLIHHHKLIGILYLENALTTGVFTESRLELLELLSSQIAVSIENAHLYEGQSDQNRKLGQSNQALEKAKVELIQSQKELIQSQSQLVQSEKMASLGVLVSGIGHEINNPTNFLNIHSHNLEKELKSFQDWILNALTEDADQEVEQMFKRRFSIFFKGMESIREGCKRIKEIVGNLRTFSLMGQGDQQKRAQLVEGLQATLFLVEPKYREEVKFVSDFQANPELLCFPNQLNQVFMNMMVNACHAILQKQEENKEKENKEEENKEKIQGTLKIQTFLTAYDAVSHQHFPSSEEKSHLAICFQDTGAGMSEEVQKKIFDPFFTTKQNKEGTGLGLSITYGILERHQGKVIVHSTLGEGTSITLLLPLLTVSV